MVKGYKKYRKIKKRKPIFKKSVLIKIFLIFLVLGSALYIFFFSPLFSLKTIEIRGAMRFIEKENLRQTSWEIIRLNFLKGKSIFGFSKKELINSLKEKYPSILNISIKRKFFHTILIEITERTPLFNICDEKKCFLIDKEGIIFAPLFDENLISIHIGENLELKKQILKKEEIQKFLAITNFLKKELRIHPYQLILNPFLIQIKTKEGLILKFSPTKEIVQQLDNLKLLIEKQIGEEKLSQVEYIDLRFEKIFYKLKD